MKLLNKCPAYIRRDYPQQAQFWPQFLMEVAGFQNLLKADLSMQKQWEICASWWKNWEAPVNESHGKGVSTFYKVPALFPWCIIGRSASCLQRSVYMSMETSDGDIRTIAEMTQD